MIVSQDKLPVFDDHGLNVADPADSLGAKSEYITVLQEQALTEIIGNGLGHALEVGCGFGRLTPLFDRLGYSVIGLDPSIRLLRAAKRNSVGVDLCAGALPDLPLRNDAFDLVLLLNVLRPLHLLGIKDVCSGVTRVLRPGGRLLVLENIRARDARYVAEDWIVEKFSDQGMHLKRRVAIRASRWPMIYAIRYGLVPRRFLPTIATWEIRRMSAVCRAPHWSYHNVVFEFVRQ